MRTDTIPTTCKFMFDSRMSPWKKISSPPYRKCVNTIPISKSFTPIKPTTVFAKVPSIPCSSTLRKARGRWRIYLVSPMLLVGPCGSTRRCLSISLRYPKTTKSQLFHIFRNLNNCIWFCLFILGQYLFFILLFSTT